MKETANPEHQLILIETFDLARTIDEYEAAVKAFCQRVEQDGLSGVRIMQHYISRQRNEAFVILMFRDASFFEKHLGFISQLDELSPLSNTVKLKEIIAFGSMNEEQKIMLEKADFHFELVNEHVAGFVRAEKCSAVYR